MSKRGLDNLMTALRSADIRDLESLEMMPKQKLSHFLKSVNADNLAESDSGLRQARSTIQSFKSNKLSPQMIQETDTNQGAKQKKMAGTNLTIDKSFRAPAASAVFDIKVTRLTHAIAATLFVPLFGPLDRESDYVDVLSGLNAAGVTWVVELMTNKKGLKFTFTLGGDSDIVNVECGQVAYVNLLRACQGSILSMEQNKLNISDVLAQTQFTESYWFITNSLFGKLTKDSFVPNMFKTDLQNQNDIRIVTANWELDQETCFVVPMVDGFTALQLSITSFIKQYETSRA